MDETKKEHQVKTITAGSVLGWIFGIILVIAAFGALVTAEFIQSFILLIMALVLLPPINRMLREKAHFELSTGVKVLIIIAGFIIFTFLIRGEKEELRQNFQSSSTSPEVQQSTVRDCKESAGGSCLKIIESSYHKEIAGDYVFQTIVGQVQNIGTGKNNYNPYHGIRGTCYYQGKVVNTQGSTFELLEPGQTTTFKISVETYGQQVDECRVQVTY